MFEIIRPLAILRLRLAGKFILILLIGGLKIIIIMSWLKRHYYLVFRLVNFV